MRKTRGGCCVRFHVVHAFLLLAFVDIAFTKEKQPGPQAPSEVATTPPTPKPPRPIEYRLPTAVTPIHYILRLILQVQGPDPNEFKVKGYAIIVFKCHVATNKLMLHSNDVNVQLTTFRITVDGVSFPSTADNATFEQVEELLIITLKEYLICGVTYKLALNFTSPIRNTPEGVFYGSYQTQGQTQYFVATQFEPIHARKAFPCFDEPYEKALFTLNILRPLGWISVANTPLASTGPAIWDRDFQYQEDRFKVTPIISTYSVAFFAGKVSNTSITTQSGFKVGVYSLEHNATFSSYAENLAVKLVEFFGSYFDSQYGMQKQDFVALPVSVASAKLGLNIYRDSQLLYSESDDTEEDKLRVASTVSYATARQWSAGLVSPDWWSFLWVVEGLAGYFEHVGINSVEPGWKTWDHFVLDKLHVALLNDGSMSSRPMYRQVQEPEDIEKMYDWVAFKKAPSLLRMLSFIVDPNTFKRGITYYFKKLVLKLVRYETLLPSLIENLLAADSSVINLKDVIEPWVRQMNYPVVSVIRDFNDKNVLHVTQKRFLADPTAKDPGVYKSPYRYRWTIPLTFTSSKELNFDKSHTDIYWLNKEDRFRTITLKVPLPDIREEGGWILANVKQYGYYRVNYQIGNWEALIRQLKEDHTKIDVVNRAQIINDAWSLARAYYIPLEIALSTLEYLGNERDYLPWYTAWRELRFLGSVMAYHEMHNKFQDFVRDKTVEALQEFGLLTDLKDHMQIFTRSLVADLACHAEAKECTEEAHKAYHSWMKKKSNGIPVNVRKAVYCPAIANGGKREWKFALKALKTVKIDSQKNILLAAMACSKTESHLGKLLNLLLDPEFVLNENQALGVITSMIENRFGRPKAWLFYREEFKKLVAKFPSLKCSNSLPVIVERFHTETELQEVTTFLTDMCPDLEKTDIQKECEDKIQTNIKWVKHNMPVIQKWLEGKVH